MESTHADIFKWHSLNPKRQQLNDLEKRISKVEERAALERVKLDRKLTSEEMLIIWLLER